MDDPSYRPMTMTPRRDRSRAAKRRYDLTGGQITPVAPHNAVQGNIPSEASCSQCEQWHDGRGSRQCLRCANYRRYQMRATMRDQIVAEHIPQALLEAMAEIRPDYPNIMGMIQHMPTNLAAVLSMRYVAQMPLRTVSGILHQSNATTRRQEQIGLATLRAMMRGDRICPGKK